MYLFQFTASTDTAQTDIPQSGIVAPLAPASKKVRKSRWE